MMQIKSFTQPYRGVTIVAICTPITDNSQVYEKFKGKKNIAVKYIISGSQDEVPEDFYSSYASKQLNKKINDWCEKNNLNLYSY